MKKRFYTLTLGMLATSMMLFMTGCGESTTSTQSSTNDGSSTSTETSISDGNSIDQPMKSEWYARIIVEIPSENMKDQGNVLGQLKDSTNDYDSHDLFEMYPFGTRYLTIVFPHQEWEDSSGNYTSDFHAMDTDINDEWTFLVKTSAINSNVTLRWEGLYVLATDETKEELVKDEFLEKMWVEDTLTGKQIPVIVNGELQNYTFNMNGQNTREFRWGIGEYVKSDTSNKVISTKAAKIVEEPMEAIDLMPGKPTI